MNITKTLLLGATTLELARSIVIQSRGVDDEVESSGEAYITGGLAQTSRFGQSRFTFPDFGSSFGGSSLFDNPNSRWTVTTTTNNNGQESTETFTD